LETRVRERHSSLNSLLFLIIILVPESELLDELLTSYQSLSVATAEAIMDGRYVDLLSTSGSMKKAVVVVGHTITSTHRFPMVGTGGSTNTLDETRRGLETLSTWSTTHCGAIFFLRGCHETHVSGY